MHLLTVFPDYIVATTRAEAAAEAAAARAEAAAEAQKEASKSKAFKDPTFCYVPALRSATFRLRL